MMTGHTEQNRATNRELGPRTSYSSPWPWGHGVGFEPKALIHSGHVRTRSAQGAPLSFMPFRPLLAAMRERTSSGNLARMAHSVGPALPNSRRGFRGLLLRNRCAHHSHTSTLAHCDRSAWLALSVARGHA